MELYGFQYTVARTAFTLPVSAWIWFATSMGLVIYAKTTSISGRYFIYIIDWVISE